MPMLAWADASEPPALPADAANPKPAASKAEVRWPGGAFLLGLGLPYSALGVQLALELPHVEPFVGGGVLSALGGYAGGARIFLNANNRGGYVALTGGRVFTGSSYDVPDELFGELGGGYRFRSAPGFFWQVGGSLVLIASRYEDEPYRHGLGVDLDVAIGVSF